MRTILVGVAGRVLVGHDGGRAYEGGVRAAQRQALGRLQRCEAFTAGSPPNPAAAVRSSGARPFPPLGAELAILEEIAPSWLGVRFRAVTPAVRAQRGLPAAGANCG